MLKNKTVFQIRKLNVFIALTVVRVVGRFGLHVHNIMIYRKKLFNIELCVHAVWKSLVYTLFSICNGVFKSQLIHYDRACRYYETFVLH